MRSLFLALVILLATSSTAYTQHRFLFIGAHPDDADVLAGGTAAKLAQMGHAVKFLSVTNGDAGHPVQGGGELARRRRAEAQEAGRRLGITYEVLDHHDGELVPTLAARQDVIREIRAWKADVVVTHRTNDYHPDHRYTGVLVQDAAILVVVPNVVTDVQPLERNPVILYFQDGFRKPNPFTPDISIGIDDTYDQKIRALDAHASQFYEWLPWAAGDMGPVPETQEERIAWLKTHWTYPVTPDVAASLEKWYGPERAAEIQNAESFEIAEYGAQPSDEEVRRLFPMLGAQ